MIHIGRVIRGASEGRGWIEACVTMDDVSAPIRYEVDELYAEGLAADRSDAFVVAMMGHAIAGAHDVVFETPLSGLLCHSLTQTLAPVLLRGGVLSLRGPIAWECPPQRGGGAACPVSGGIDSFYTILTHRDDPALENLTHLACFDVGAYGDPADGPVDGRREAEWRNSEAIAKALGLPLVCVRSNVADVFFRTHAKNVIFANAGAVLALGNLWRHYYCPCSYYLGDSFPAKDSRGLELCEPLEWGLLPLLSNDRVQLRYDGGLLPRLERIRRVAENPLAWQYWLSCTDSIATEDGALGCGKCWGCVRNALFLRALGEPVYRRMAPRLQEEWAVRHWGKVLRRMIKKALHGELDASIWRSIGRFVLSQTGWCEHLRLLPSYLRHPVRFWRMLCDASVI